MATAFSLHGFFIALLFAAIFLGLSSVVLMLPLIAMRASRASRRVLPAGQLGFEQAEKSGLPQQTALPIRVPAPQHAG